MRAGLDNTRGASRILWELLIVTVSVTVAMVGAWWVPGVDLYAHDWFMRLRGPLALPTDIAIVAIDEPSIARYGRFRSEEHTSELQSH